MSDLAEGAYAWHARTYDTRAYSAWSVASGTFVSTANGSSDVTEFLYGTSPYSLYERVPADQPGGTATIDFTPWLMGVQSPYVVSLDRAHNASPVRQYTFNVRSCAVSVWPTGQAPDPAGSRAILVTLHFTTQAGNGLTTIAYAIDDGPWQSVPVGVDGVVDAVTPPVTTGPHTLTYSGRDGTGASQFDATSTFYGSDEPTASTRSRGPAAASG